MDSFQPPLQLKGEIMDLDFTVDTDHRKRRRNRTTQSCLNCHTSKRKCDRKRPCQRCIQLGLTGLCVYEIDDPALRDDPSIDESTRLRNRIAELESLVRELRGKPHPRWAEGNFRDGDPSERWHSRASKCQPSQAKRRDHSPTHGEDHNSRSVPASLLAPIKTEPSADGGQHLYRFSPSPGPNSVRYHNFPSANPSPPLSTYDADHQQPYSAGSNHSNRSNVAYPSSPVPPYNNQHQHSGHSPYSNSGYHSADCDDGRSYPQQYPQSVSTPPTFCGCRTNPAAGHALIQLSHQLQSTLDILRQYAQHPTDTQCLLYRRIISLNELMHDPEDVPGPSYGALPTPTDSEILTPLSASSTPYHTPGSAPQEWNTVVAAGYNPYFPLQPVEHEIYNNVIT